MPIFPRSLKKWLAWSWVILGWKLEKGLEAKLQMKWGRRRIRIACRILYETGFRGSWWTLLHTTEGQITSLTLFQSFRSWMTFDRNSNRDGCRHIQSWCTGYNTNSLVLIIFILDKPLRVGIKLNLVSSQIEANTINHARGSRMKRNRSKDLHTHILYTAQPLWMWKLRYLVLI